MQHFLNLDKCQCGAYRYLAVREHKKSFEIYMIHHKHFSSGQDVRKYRKLASIPKFRINIHDVRVDQEQRDTTVKLSYEEITVLKLLLRQIESGKSQRILDEIEDDFSERESISLGDTVSPIQEADIEPH